MSKGVQQRLLWVGLAAAVFGVATLTVAPRAAAQEAKLRLDVPSAQIRVGDPAFAVEVAVDDVVNLGAFEFDLTYDSSVLEFVGVDVGPFLGSSGRNVRCLDPRVHPGYVRFVCVTLGATPARGADGSGVLATVTLAPTGPGTSPLHFDSAILVQPDGQAIPGALQDASITVASPGLPPTPLPTGTAPTATAVDITPAKPAPTQATPTQATPAQATLVNPTATLAAPPATAVASSSDGGTNWPLWGSIIGGAAVLVVAAAGGVTWWSRARKQS